MSGWFPEVASNHARAFDGPFTGAYFAALLVLVGFVGLAVVFVVLYKRQDRDQLGAPAGQPNRFFLGIWVLLALGLALGVYTAGFKGFLDRSIAPFGADEIAVTARQWDWDFGYPGGVVTDTLHVVAGRPVKLLLRSEDVLHSLAVPAMRVNQAIVPGRTTEAWFQPTLPGLYGLQSNVFSGDGHLGMQSALVVHDQQGYEDWLEDVQDIFAGRSLPEAGELLVNRHGCLACHSLTGQNLVGPSFKNLYGNEFDTVEGTRVIADDAYIKQSILEPGVSIVAGFQPVMTPYAGKLDDREIGAIVAWLKTRSDLWEPDAAGAAEGLESPNPEKEN